LPGVLDTVTELHRRGYRLGVCSNKLRQYTRRLLDHLGLLPVVAAVVGPEDVARLKPAPDMLLAALRTLDVPAGEALYVGDMRVDIETARAAGVPVWVVATGSDTLETLRTAGPDRVLAEFRELAALLPA
jgi:HAD superfamily hydrolase (TIGR01509 family)